MERGSLCSILSVILFTSTLARVTVKDDVLFNGLDDNAKKISANDHLLSIPQPKVAQTAPDKMLTKHISSNKISNYISINATQNNTTAIPRIAEINNNAIDTNNSIPLKKKDGNDPDRRFILTTYIEEGRIEEGRKASEVNPDLFLGFKSYSGYFTVNKTYDSNIFFWYFPVENKSVNNTPWIIWLQGGPGVTSLNGLFDEIGPFTTNRKELIRNPYTWLGNHSLLFIDNPVGTGFSFTRDKNGLVTDMKTYADHLYSTLKQFLQIFPELRVAPLFVAGESYGGKYAPALAMEIHKHKHTPTGDINLQGVILGNAMIEPTVLANTTNIFYQFGLLTQEQLDIAQPIVSAFQNAIANNNSVEAKTLWGQMISVLLRLSRQAHAYNILKYQIDIGRFILFVNQSEIRNALHVGNARFSFLNIEVKLRLAPDFLSSTRPLIESLLNEYRVLAYCGQLDLTVPCTTAAELYRRWKWNHSEDYLKADRIAYFHKRKLAAYSKSGGNFTEVMITGAGHMVPLDEAEVAQKVIAHWTINKPLATAMFDINELTRKFINESLKNNNTTII